MRFRSEHELELSEDQDPGSFPSEKARLRSIGFDRWAGRHPVLFTVLTAVAMAGVAWFALLHASERKFPLRLALYTVLAVGVTAQVGWLSLKARRRYRGR